MVTLLAKEQTVEVRMAVDRVLNDIEGLGNQIKQAENPGTYVSKSYAGDKDQATRTIAFDSWVRRGLDSLTQEQRKAMMEFRDVAEGAPMLNHIGTYTGLGFFVPTGFVDRVEQATKYYADLLNDGTCTVVETATGNPLPYPVSDDTGNAAVIVGEASTVNEQDVTANHVKLVSYKLSSGVVKASIELLDDSSIDIQDWLAKQFGVRYGRGLEGFLTNGTGSGQPTGIIPAIAASGATPVVAVGSSANSGNVSETGANSIGYQDLVNLEHSVDPTYRRGAKYMFHDQTLGKLKGILDKFGRPLWAPGIGVGDPDRLNGYPYVINQSMSQIGPSNTSVVFGDFSKFVIRKVKGMRVQRLNELYAINQQVGFLSSMRVDSNLVSAVQPLNVLMQHS
jgi:HK97 family phage major capsid protein